MITAEIRVNGVMIGNLNATNLGQAEDTPDFIYQYRFVQLPEGTTVNGAVQRPRVLDSGTGLLGAILTQVSERLMRKK